MKLPGNDPRSHKFATSIGLIILDEPNWPNIIPCEWTYIFFL